MPVLSKRAFLTDSSEITYYTPPFSEGKSYFSPVVYDKEEEEEQRKKKTEVGALI